MEDTADRQQAIQSIKISADDLITKVKSKEHEGLPEEERIKIDGRHQYPGCRHHLILMSMTIHRVVSHALF